MVLAELGSRLSKALNKAASSVLLNEREVDELVNEIGKALLESDVNVRLVKQLQCQIQKGLAECASGSNRRKVVNSVVINALFSLLNGSKEGRTGGGCAEEGEPKRVWQPEKNRVGGNVVMFVGLQGAGKTTTCMKYARFWKNKGFRVGLVCADTFRAGAYDQLKQNAVLAGVPFYGSYIESDPAVVAAQGVARFREANFDFIIVDTSGRHKQERALFAEMQEVERVTTPDEIVFVMDGSIGQAAFAQATAFREAVKIGSVIITKLDGHAKGGGALSAVAATQAPIAFIGTGEHVKDFEEFDAKRFVQRLLGFGDMQGLLSVMSDGKLLEKQRESKILAKLSAGPSVEDSSTTTSKSKTNKKKTPDADFTFRDMYDQMQMLLGMGDIGSMINMMPGMSNLKLPGDDSTDGSGWQKRIQRFMVVMDSMHSSELDNDTRIFKGTLGHSRIRRLASGAGVPLVAIEQVIDTFLPFQSVLRRLRDSGMMKMLSGFGGVKSVTGSVANQSKVDGESDLKIKNKKKKKIQNGVEGDTQTAPASTATSTSKATTSSAPTNAANALSSLMGGQSVGLGAGFNMAGMMSQVQQIMQGQGGAGGKRAAGAKPLSKNKGANPVMPSGMPDMSSLLSGLMGGAGGGGGLAQMFSGLSHETNSSAGKSKAKTR